MGYSFWGWINEADSGYFLASSIAKICNKFYESFFNVQNVEFWTEIKGVLLG